MRVGPVDLAGRPEIEVLILAECLRLVRPGQLIERSPVRWRHLLLLFGNRRVGRHRLVAGKHTRMELLIPCQIDRVLAISIDEAFIHGGFDPRKQISHGDDLDHSLDNLPGYEPQGHMRDDTEQAVATDREREELRILFTTALQVIAGMIDHPE